MMMMILAFPTKALIPMPAIIGMSEPSSDVTHDMHTLLLATWSLQYILTTLEKRQAQRQRHELT